MLGGYKAWPGAYQSPALKFNVYHFPPVKLLNSTQHFVISR